MSHQLSAFNFEADFICKIIVVGSYQTGKTSLVEQYVNETFARESRSTIGVDFRVKHLNYDDKIIKAYIWDTAGQERFMTIVSSYYRTINGAILVFDLSDKESFDMLDRWMTELENHKKGQDITIMLVGNKSDLGKCEVTENNILEFMQKANCPIQYIKASAKTGHNVSKIFETLVYNVYEKNKQVKTNEKNFLQIEMPTTKKTWANYFGCW